MNQKKLIIDTNGLTNEIQVFEEARSNINDIFNHERKIIQELNNGHTWVGTTQEKLYEMEVEFQNNFDPILEALEVLINFMKKVVEDYEKDETTLEKNVEDNNENLKVN